MKPTFGTARIVSFLVVSGGQIKAKWDEAGINVSSLDSQIAATAQRHDLTVLTGTRQTWQKRE